MGVFLWKGDYMNKVIEDNYIYLVRNNSGEFVYDIYLQKNDELIGRVAYAYNEEDMEKDGSFNLKLRSPYKNTTIKRSIFKLTLIVLQRQSITKRGRI